MKRVHVLILTHTRGFKVSLTTHFKCSGVFDWNTRLMRSMKSLNTDAYARLKGILNDTLQVFWSVRLERETHVKYETYPWSNTDAHVKYWGPHTKACISPKRCSNCRVWHIFEFLYQFLGFLTKLNPPERKKKKKKQDNMHVIPTKSKQLTWLFISFQNLILYLQIKDLILSLVCVCLF